MVYSNTIRTASVYAVLLLLSLVLISNSLPTVDSKKKEDDGISDRADGGMWEYMYIFLSISFVYILCYSGNTSVCGDLSYSGPTGTFHSPNYPAAYGQNNIDCRYYISVNASVSQRILLAFSDFATESCCDYVEVRRIA